MGSKGSQQSTTVNMPNPEAMAAYRESVDRARTVSNTPWVGYDGQLVAGMNPTQQAGQAAATASGTSYQPGFNAASDLLGGVSTNINPEQFSDEAIARYMSPYLSSVVGSTMANLQRNNAQQSQGLKSGAIQAGAFGGDRSGLAQANMAREQNLAMGQTLGGLLNQGYGQALGEFNNQQQTFLSAQQADAQRQMALAQAQQGLGQANQQANINASQAQLQAGQVQQQTEQAQLEAAYNQFMLQRAYPFQTAGWFSNIAQGIGSQMGGTSTSTQPGPSVGGQIAGGIGAIGSLASMFSDERMKENIEPIGKAFDGQMIYKYNFKGDPKTQIGLMAQEVEHRHPEAVNNDLPMKRVDYDAALSDAADRGAFASGGGISGAPFGSIQGWVPAGPLQPGNWRAPEVQRKEQKEEDIGKKLKEGQDSFKSVKDLGSKVAKWVTGGPTDLQGATDAIDTGSTMPSLDENNIGSLAGSWGFAQGGPVFQSSIAPLALASGPGSGIQMSLGEILGGGGGGGGTVSGALPSGVTADGNQENWDPGPTTSGDTSSAADRRASIDSILAANRPRIDSSSSFAAGGAAWEPSDEDLDAASRTLVGEARGEPEEGQRAVLHVIRNRRDSGRWGDDIGSVVKAPLQFSAWNKGDPNRELISNISRDDPRYIKARGLAERVMRGQDEDPTKGALNFYNPNTVSPAWARGKEGQDIGNHRFLTADGSGGLPAAEEPRMRAIAQREAPPRSIGEVQRPTPRGAEEPSFLQRLLGGNNAPSESGDKKSILESLTGIKLSPEAQQGLLAASLKMMSSRSPWFATQLGEGGLEGIKAYNEAKKTNAGVEATQAGSRSTSLDAVRKSMQETPGGNFIWLADGTMVPLAEYLKNPKPVLGFRPSKEQVDQAATAPGALPPPKSAPVRPEVVQRSPEATAATPPAAPEAPNAFKPPAEAPPVKEGTAEPEPKKGAPYYYDPALGENTIKEIEREKAQLVSGPRVGLETATAASQKMRADADTDYAAATALRQNLNDLSRSVMKLPREGSFLTAGSSFDARVGMAKLAQTVLRSVGRNDLAAELADPEIVKQGDIQKKLSNLMGQLGASAGHQTAHAALASIAENVPTGNMTPEAAAKLLAELYVNQQKSIDRHKYMNNYIKAMGGLPAQYATAAFERDNPVSKYEKEKKLIEEIMLARGKGKDGKERYQIDDVFKYDPHMIDKKKNSPWLSRYFVGG